MIADIHGDLEGLCSCLLSMYDVDLDLREDKIVFLGDYIDSDERGSSAKGVVEFIRELQDQFGDHVVALRGNHEQLLIDSLGKTELQSALRMWWYQGGWETWNSYKHENEEPVWLLPFGDELTGKPQPFTPNPEFAADIEWFTNLPYTYQEGNLIFVHGGLVPPLPLEAQKEKHLMWVREEFYDSPYEWSDKWIIYGHTARSVPLIKYNVESSGGKLGLDCKWHGQGYVAGALFVDGELQEFFPYNVAQELNRPN